MVPRPNDPGFPPTRLTVLRRIRDHAPEERRTSFGPLAEAYWKPVAAYLGLGIFDGLSALVSAPETAPQILGIVIGSTFKGLLAGVLIGWFARKVDSVPMGVLFGLFVGAFFAFLVALMPNEEGGHYWWQIMLPGSVLGLIVGYATQRYGRSPRPLTA